MVIDDLYRILPKPAAPLETGDSKRWNEVFEAMGTRLPEDYVQFIQSYGSGSIDNELTVWNPFAVNPNVNLLRQFAPVLSVFREVKTTWPDQIPYGLYFEPGGLLPWGATANGDYLFWKTDGTLIDDWGVVTIPSRGGASAIFGMPMTIFLERLLSHEIAGCIAYPDWWPRAEGRRFVQHAGGI